MTMRLQAATVRFGAVTALEDASVDIQPGVVTAVIGPNAAGKSTLLRVLAGLQRLQAGVVSIVRPILLFLPPPSVWNSSGGSMRLIPVMRLK